MQDTQNKLFTNTTIIGAVEKVENAWLLIEGKTILEMGLGKAPALNATETIDCHGQIMLPGFIDLHTHGALGNDFVFAKPEHIQQISRFYAIHGVTSFLATTYSATPDEIKHACHNIASCMSSETGARILGIHLEGPWINPQKAGAQSLPTIRPADPIEVIPYLDSDLIRLVALAPEVQENQWLISECKKRKITIAAGHTAANYLEMLEAINNGVSQITHCFNAMTPLHHREPGAIGAALISPDVRCELIADNIHVHPALMKLLAKAKGVEGVILVTDSIAAAGMPDGEYSLEGQKVILNNGVARLQDGTLAGSTLTMDTALRNFLTATSLSLEQAWCCTSLNPAQAIGVDDHKGKIAAGFDADLVLLDSNLHVTMTISEGRIIYHGER